MNSSGLVLKYNSGVFQNERPSFSVVGAKSGIKDVVIPAFYSKYSLSGNIEEISESAFKDNDEIESIVLPHGLKNNKTEAFYTTYNTSKIERIVIPETVIEIGSEAFNSYFTKIYVGKKFRRDPNGVGF